METKKRIIEIVQNAYACEAGVIALQEKVRAALVPFVGKPVNKRMATAVQKALGDNWRILLDRPTPTLKYIRCVPHDAQNKFRPYKWDDRVRFSLPDSYFFHIGMRFIGGAHIPGFDYINGDTGGAHAKARQKQRVALLANDKKLESIAALIDTLNATQKALAEILNEWTTGRAAEQIIPDDVEIKKLVRDYE